MFVLRLSKQVAKDMRAPAYCLPLYIKFLFSLVLLLGSQSILAGAWPFGTFAGTTFVGGGDNSGSGFGGQGGFQNGNRFQMVGNGVQTINGLDYSNSNSGTSWIFTNNLNTVFNLSVVRIQGGGTAFVTGTGSLTINHSGDSNPYYGLLTNLGGSPHSVINASSSGSLTINLSNNAGIAHGSGSGSTAIISGGLCNLTLGAGSYITGRSIFGYGTWSLNGGGNVDGSVAVGSTLNLNYNSTGRILGAITAGNGTFTIGSGVNATPSSSISGFTNLTLNSNSTFTTNGALSFSGTVSVGTGATLNAGHTISGGASINNLGTVNNNAVNAIAVSGVFNNGISPNPGILTLNSSLSRSTTFVNIGNVTLNSGTTYTQTAGFFSFNPNLIAAASTGAMSGVGAFTINSGVDARWDDTKAYSPATAGLSFTGAFTINSGALFRVNQNLNRNQSTSNSGTIEIASGKTYTHSGATSGTKLILNAGGTLVDQSTGGIFTNNGLTQYNNSSSTTGMSFSGLFTNSGASAEFDVMQDLTRSSATNTSAAFVITSGKTFTNTSANFTLSGGSISSTSGSAGAFFNSGGTVSVTENAAISASSSNTGDIKITAGKTFTNQGTMTNDVGGTISETGASGVFTNQGAINFQSTTPNSFTFTGLFTNSGTLSLIRSFTRANNVTNTGTISIASTMTYTQSGGTLLFSPSTTSVATAAISGAGSLTNSGAIVTWNDSKAFTTPSTAFGFTGTFLNQGTFNVQQNLTRASNTTNSGAGTIAITDTKTYTQSGGTLLFDPTSNVALSAISGAGSLTNSGAIVTWNDSKAFTTPSTAFGFTGTFLNQGTFNVQQNLNRASNVTNSVGGTIAISDTKTYTQSGGTLLFSPTTTAATTAAVSGLGSLTNSGAIVTWNDSKTFSPTSNGFAFTGTFLNQGTFNVQQNLIRASNTTNSGAGTIAISNTMTYTQSGGTLLFDPTSNVALSAISGAGSLTNSGAIVTWNDSKAFTTPSTAFGFTGTFLNQGTFNVKQDLNRASNVTNSGSSASLNGTIVLDPAKTYTQSGGTLLFDPTFSVGVSAISGAGALTNSGAIVTWNDSKAFTTASTAFGFTGLFTNQGTFNVNQNLNRASNVTNSGSSASLNGTIVLASGKTYTQSGGTLLFDPTFSIGVSAISGAGALTNSGATVTWNDSKAFTTLSTAFGFTGTFLNQGTFNVQQNLNRASNTTNSGALGTIVLTSGKTYTQSGGTLLFDPTSTVALGAITGAGSLTNSGATVTWNDSKAFTIPTNAMGFTGTFLNQGTFNVQQNLNRASNTTNSGALGTIVLTSGMTYTQSGGTLLFDPTSTVGLGAITGAGSLTNSGAIVTWNDSKAFTTPTNAMGFTGTFLNQGTFNVQQNLNRASNTTNSGAAGTIVLTGTYTQSGGVLLFSPTSNVALGAITGTGGLTNSGATVTWNDNKAFATPTNAMGFTGTFLNQGTFNVQQNLNRASNTTNSGAAGTIVLTAAMTYTQSGGTLLFDPTTNPALGAMTGAGALTNSGGIITWNDSKTYNTPTDALGFTGLFNNVSGTFNVNQDLNRNQVTTNTGTITILGGKTYTHSGALVGTKLTFNAGGVMTDGTTAGGAFTNSGIFDYNNSSTANGLTFTGLFTNSGSGTLNVLQDLTRASTTSNSGTISIANTKTFTNTGTMTTTGTVSTTAGASTFTSSGTLNVNSGGNITATTFNIDGAGILNVNGSGAVGVNINGTAVSAANTTALNVGPAVTPTAFTPGGDIINIRTINIINGSSLTTTAGNPISGVNTLFNIGSSVGSGSSVVFASDISGTGIINNYGTLTYNTGPTSAANAMVGFPTINAYTNSALNFNTSVTLVDTDIIAASGSTGTTLSIANNSTLETNALIDDIKTINIALGSTLKLNSGANVTGNNDAGGRTINLDGTLQISELAEFTIGSADVLNGATSGSILNSGTLTLDGSDLTLGGSFNNTSTGIFQINGTPSILFSAGVTNSGAIVATFNTSNSLPVITTTAPGGPNLANGTIIISYQNNYIAGGDYLFIDGPNPGITTANVGGYFLPQPSTYIRSWALTVTDGDVNVTVDRIGFGQVATNPIAQEIGNYLEELGENNPSASILALLNALEQITDPDELNAALLEIVTPEYVPLQSLAMLDNDLNIVQGRIAHVRTGFSAGEIDLENGLWIRPFISSSRQRPDGNLQGYTARVHGFAFGVDHLINSYVLLGAAGSLSKAKVTDEVNLTSQTDISSYQAMVYGTFHSKTDAYLDWILSTGINNYHAMRNMQITTFNATAFSNYSGQQFTFKTIASKSYVWKKFYQLTPLASLQYSFLKQQNYTETGAGDFNRIINQDNINLLQLGIGGQISVPFSQGKISSIPEAHLMFLVDAKGGAQDTNSQFISGGPILVDSVQSGKLMMRIGGSLTFAISDRLQLIANYDFECRSKYISNEVYVNLKYTF